MRWDTCTQSFSPELSQTLRRNNKKRITGKDLGAWVLAIDKQTELKRLEELNAGKQKSWNLHCAEEEKTFRKYHENNHFPDVFRISSKFLCCSLSLNSPLETIRFRSKIMKRLKAYSAEMAEWVKGKERIPPCLHGHQWNFFNQSLWVLTNHRNSTPLKIENPLRVTFCLKH